MAFLLTNSLAGVPLHPMMAASSQEGRAIWSELNVVSSAPANPVAPGYTWGPWGVNLPSYFAGWLGEFLGVDLHGQDMKPSEPVPEQSKDESPNPEDSGFSSSRCSTPK